MDALNSLLSGLAGALTPEHLMYVFIGVLIGTVVGVLPGLGPITSIALLIPFSFQLPPTAGLIMLCGVYYGAMYGGSITSILIRTPGEVASAVTALEGYEMAKRGKAGPALATAAVGSFIGGSLAVLGLVFLSPVLVDVSTSFGAAEYAVLLVGALALTTSLMTGSRIKALISVLFGMCVGIIGLDPQDSVQRWTFGQIELSDGIDIALLAMALFAIPEALRHLSVGERRAPSALNVQRAWMDKEDLRRSSAPYARGTVVGFIAGVMPGLGPTLGSFASYALERRVAKPERRKVFGRGAIEGVAGPETANNAGVGGAMVPMLALAIPGSATTALLLFVFQMYGLQPGPQLFQNDGDLVWTIIASMLVGNAMLLVLNLPMVRVFVKLLKVPPPLLYGGVVAFVMLGAYALTFSLFSLLTLVVIGLIGFVMQEHDFPLTPAILAAVLLPLLELNLRRSLLIANGDWTVFFTRPISLTILVLIVLGVVVPPLLQWRRNSRAAAAADSPAEDVRTGD
ncbi:tripartite tricarboxylate transporter permease [Ornithinicoccus hortensis]|uniref:Putative tricarboxylic transport membrane protein n=1 Tax=Ornithinicoccus hortensis TaxID=82346 RepID=A0A542YQF1_9MICO|nr:tripartite tricarboxylate transporter permease [Ornithinicoccus hortensis]TQL50335.1 putative tricarboxylic transport membrane protein [Ornithinicoccus hortensis]